MNKGRYGIRRGAAAAALGLVALVAAPPRGRAEPEVIPVVSLGEAGPDRQIPTRGAFYLTGKVEAKVAAVYPVFVRIAYPPFGAGGGQPCALAQKSLTAARLVKVNGTPVLEKSSGVFDIDRLWAPPSGAEGIEVIDEYERLSRRHNAYVPPAWIRSPKMGNAEEASYQVLVSAPRYFRPGATYCLFVYEQHKISEQEKQAIPKLLRDHRAKRAACELSTDKAAAPRCASEADSELIKGLERPLSEVGKEQASRVFFKVRTELVNAVREMATFVPEIKKALDPASFSPKFGGAEGAWSPPRDYIDVEADPLGHLMAELLASKGHIHRVVRSQSAWGYVVDRRGLDCANSGDGCKGRVEYTTRSGSITIRFIRIRPSLDVFEVAAGASPGPGGRDEIAVSAGALPLYGTSITLEDAMELARGRVKLAKRYIDLRDVYAAVIKPAIDRQEAAVAKTGTLDDPPEIRELASTIEALRSAVSLACSGAAALKPPAGRGKDASAASDRSRAAVAESDRLPFERAVQALAGLWLERSALGDCAAYAGPERDPLATIAELTLGYLDALRTWRDNEATMTVAITKISTEHPRRAPIEVQSRMTQEAFFDHYVTPVLGRAALIKPGADIGMTYAGLQVFLWPNDVSEPMWSNGSSDLLRLVGLEFGAGLETSEFGEGSVFSGLGPLPPLFVGGAIHAVPYLTLSLGASLMERKQSAAQEQSGALYASFYAGITAQLNVIGILRSLVMGRGMSKAEEK